MMETMSNEVAVIFDANFSEKLHAVVYGVDHFEDGEGRVVEFAKIDEATFNGNTELDFLFFFWDFSFSGVNEFVVGRVPRNRDFFPIFWSVFRIFQISRARDLEVFFDNLRVDVFRWKHKLVQT